MFFTRVTTPWRHTSINDCPRPSVQIAETLSFTRTLSTNGRHLGSRPGRDPKLYWDPKYKWQRPSVQILVPSLERTWPRFLFLHQRRRRKSDAGSIHSQCTLSWRRAFLAVPGRPERALQRAHRHGNSMGRGRHGEPGAFNALCAPLRADFATGVARAARANRKASAERCGDRNQAPVANAHDPTCAESLGPVGRLLSRRIGHQFLAASRSKTPGPGCTGAC